MHPLQVWRARTASRTTNDEEADPRRHQGHARRTSDERDDFRRHIIELKTRRRIRARHDHDDRVREHRHHAVAGAGDGARGAHDARRRRSSTRSRRTTQLIPDPGELSATLLIELHSEAQLREWLPEARRHPAAYRHRASRRQRGAGGRREDEERLTREDTTAGRALPELRVHGRAGRRRSQSGPVHIVLDHPAYREDVELTESQRAELLGDLRATA